MIWFNKFNGLLYTIKDGCVYCKRRPEDGWRKSGYATGVKTFLSSVVSTGRYTVYNLSLENK